MISTARVTLTHTSSIYLETHAILTISETKTSKVNVVVLLYVHNDIKFHKYPNYISTQVGGNALSSNIAKCAGGNLWFAQRLKSVIDLLFSIFFIDSPMALILFGPCN